MTMAITRLGDELESILNSTLAALQLDFKEEGLTY